MTQKELLALIPGIDKQPRAVARASCKSLAPGLAREAFAAWHAAYGEASMKGHYKKVKARRDAKIAAGRAQARAAAKAKG